MSRNVEATAATVDLGELRQYLLAKSGATEETPFGPATLVYKVAGKMFALVFWQSTPLSLNLKCVPQLAEMLRATYPAVRPGYHMHKRHWNTVLLDATLPAPALWEMIDHSYDQVVKGLSKSERARRTAAHH
jgi:predicted DNA-binding protein (MmcQ/YjbR family)